MVFEKLKKLITEQFGVDESTVTLETSLREDLSADSLDMVEMMMAMEEAFEIGEVDEGEIAELDTVGEIASFIQAKL